MHAPPPVNTLPPVLLFRAPLDENHQQPISPITPKANTQYQNHMHSILPPPSNPPPAALINPPPNPMPVQQNQGAL